MNKYVKKKRKKRIIIFSALLFLVLVFLDFQLRPIIKTVAVSKAQVVSTNAINEAILEELSRNDIDYSNLISIEKGTDGKVLAITTDVKKINQLRSHVSVLIQEKLSQTKMRQVSLPLGTFTGIEILNGRGPCVPLRISISGSVNTEFTSNFSEAGINQTKHQIFINVNTKISAMIPGYPAITKVSTNMPIAETVIVGKVPRLYANNNSKDMKDIAGISNLEENNNK